MLGAAAVLILCVAAFAGLWLHAASVESGEADRIEIGKYSARGAHLVGDVLVLDQSSSTVVYSVDSQSELGSYESYGIHTAEGPIIAAIQTTGGLVAINDEGEAAWEMGSGATAAERDSYWPQAAGSEGTIITRECREERREITECEMIGVDIAGDVQWRTEASADFLHFPWRSSSTSGSSGLYPLTAEGLDSLYDRDTQIATIRIFDPEDGEIETFDEPPRVSFHGISTIGLTEPVPGEYYADSDEELCELSVQGPGMSEAVAVTHSCHLLISGFPVGEYVSFGSFDSEWMAEADLEPSDEMGLLHIQTGQWVPTAFPGELPDEVIRSAAGLAERVGDTWFLSGIDESGAEFHHELPGGHEPVAFSRDTVVAETALESWNPLVDEELRELAVIDAAMGETCAVTSGSRYRTRTVDPIALTDCQALVRDDDGLAYLVGHE